VRENPRGESPIGWFCIKLYVLPRYLLQFEALGFSHRRRAHPVERAVRIRRAL
jgi:hypothetical protein